MADASTAAQLFAFAVFFIPGYVSLNVGSFLITGVRLRVPWPEKVILSFVWSAVIYLTVYSIRRIDLNFDTVVSAIDSVLILELLIASLALGLVAGFVYFVGLLVLDRLPKVGKRIGGRVGLGWAIKRLEGFYFESASERFLRSIFESRGNNDVVVETTSDRVFRGMLGSLSVKPTLDLVLQQRVSGDTTLKVEQALCELDRVTGTWKPLKEFSLMIPQGNIRSVYGIKRGEGIS